MQKRRGRSSGTLVGDGRNGAEAGKGRLLKRVARECSMPVCGFTEEEIDEVRAWFERTPAWARWDRRVGEQGQDVLEIVLEGRRAATVRVSKAGASKYLATGFAGWGLTVCDELAELLRILATFAGEANRGQAASKPRAA
jgi:hypothetical protein